MGTATTTNVDTILDFLSGTDMMQLSKSVFAAFSGTGTLSADAFWSATNATAGHDADDRIIFNSSTGALYYDNDGLGGNEAIQIAIVGISSSPNIAFTDFAVIA